MESQVSSQPAVGRRDHKQHFTGRHLVNIPLTASTSLKDTRHHEIRIEQDGITYLPGDALGVHARNQPQLVDRVLKALGATGSEPVTRSGHDTVSLAQVLSEQVSLAAPSRRLIELLAERGATHLASLLDPDHTAELKHFISGPEAHDILDVLEQHPDHGLTPDEFVGTLRSSLPRLYSIASSLQAHPSEVHVLVISLVFTIRGRERRGMGSTWINDGWPVGGTAEMYVQSQQAHFALPTDPTTPMIMVGPGTGIAPFRAFLEERRVTEATGPNWLFFGEQHRAQQFYYEPQLSEYVKDGFLRLDTAFSRDQPEKIYVQHRLREHARDIWDWLEQGAEFFVCGDKARMAADVDAELHRIVETVGGRTPEAAREYIAALKTSKRYKRDVY